MRNARANIWFTGFSWFFAGLSACEWFHRRDDLMLVGIGMMLFTAVGHTFYLSRAAEILFEDNERMHDGEKRCMTIQSLGGKGYDHGRKK